MKYLTFNEKIWLRLNFYIALEYFGMQLYRLGGYVLPTHLIEGKPHFDTHLTPRSHHFRTLDLLSSRKDATILTKGV